MATKKQPQRKRRSAATQTQDLTDNPIVKAIARLAQIVGLPIAAWLFMQVWGDIKEMKGKLETFSSFNSAIKVQVDMNEHRVERIERKIENYIDSHNKPQ